MDNSDLRLPDAAVAGFLPASLWPAGGGMVAMPLYITRYAGPRASQPLAAHPFWEITYVLGGQGVLELGEREGEETIALPPESGLLLPPGSPHRERSGSGKWDTLWLAFRGQLPSQLGVAAPLLLGDGHALRPWAELLWRWAQREPGMIGPELEALSEFFVRAFVRLAQAGGTAQRQPWLKQIQEYIDHHLEASLGVADLARVAGLSVGHFHRQFRQATGETPLAYLTRRRLEVAWLYLRQSGLPIKEIARAVGFGDPLYFSRVFRRRFGCPPTAAAPGRGDG